MPLQIFQRCCQEVESCRTTFYSFNHFIKYAIYNNMAGPSTISTNPITLNAVFIFLLSINLQHHLSQNKLSLLVVQQSPRCWLVL